VNWLAVWFLHRKVCQLSHDHLSPTERYQIEVLLAQHLSVAQIATRLLRHRSTIYRELARCPGRYHAEPDARQRRNCALRSAANAPRYAASVWQQVLQQLRQHFWSPQQIAGRAVLQSLDMPSWQAIYGSIARSWPDRCERPLRRTRRKRRGNGPASVFGWARSVQPIAVRPTQVHQRVEPGHWEAGTMVGTRGGFKARLLVCVERVSRYTRLALLQDGLPETAAAAMKRCLMRDARWPVLSITTDRGIKFARLATVVDPERLYVCDAQRPNQRGTNENTIGLVRQFIPKGQALSLETPKSIARIERLLNNRPRLSGLQDTG